MRVRTLIAGAIAGVVLAGGVATTSSVSAQAAQPTLAQILASQGPIGDRNWYDFDIINGVVGEILKANPSSPLALAADPNSPKLTVFLPNDRAFQVLAADLLGWKYLFANEAQVAGALLKAIPIATLETVVRYHVHVGYIDAKTALSVPRGTKVPMLAGGSITVTPLRLLGTAVLGDNDRNDIDPLLVKSRLDIKASNGIAHGISFVLRPIDLK
jgi:hypothetical protein